MNNNPRQNGSLGGEITRNFWLQKYLGSPKYCRNCNKQLPFEKRKNSFCDCSCAARKNNLGVRRNWKGGKRETCCKACGKETTNLKYCSKKCVLDGWWKVFCEKIEKFGKLVETKNSIYGYSPPCAKKYLGEKRGHKCEICHLEEWLGNPIPLVLDHINGDPTDHKLSNIRLVCGNCNMLLPTFAGGNKGNGRKNRKINA